MLRTLREAAGGNTTVIATFLVQIFLLAGAKKGRCV